MKSQTKVIIRRLPKSLTKEQFLTAIHPYKNFNYLRFCSADNSHKHLASTRVYIDFDSEDDMYRFKNDFDYKLFIDDEGNESYGFIEYAVFQKICGSNKYDSKQNTIANDPDYLKFVEEINDLAKPDGVGTVESNLEEIKNREADKLNIVTPLIEYINNLPKRGRKDDYRRKNDYGKSFVKKDPDNIAESKVDIKAIKKNVVKENIVNSEKIDSVKIPEKTDIHKIKPHKRNDIKTYAANYEDYPQDNNGYYDERVPKRVYETKYHRGGGGGYGGGRQGGSYDIIEEPKSSYYGNKSRNEGTYQRAYGQETYGGYQGPSAQDYAGQSSRPSANKNSSKRGGGRRPPSYSATRKD